MVHILYDFPLNKVSFCNIFVYLTFIFWNGPKAALGLQFFIFKSLSQDYDFRDMFL